MGLKTTYKELLIAIIQSLDLVNPILKHHHRRVAVIAYHIGKEYGLNDEDMKTLVMTASVHDIGALTVKERDELLVLDVLNPYAHSYLGAAMIEGLPYFEDISATILHHHLKWEYSEGIDQRIAEICSILHLSDRVDVLIQPGFQNRIQKRDIIDKLSVLVGTIFRPRVFESFLKCAERDLFWLDIDHMNMQVVLNEVLDDAFEIPVTFDLLEKFANTLAKVIDFRSEFTATHSQGVSAVAYKLASYAGLSKNKMQKIKIAGLLHDIGKMGISTELIEKKDRLTPEEFDEMKTHTYYTYSILSNISSIRDISLWALSHHEKQDGSGYPFKLMHEQIGKEAAILALADVFTALSEDRPYRMGLPLDKVSNQMKLTFKSCEYPDLLDLVDKNANKLNEIRIEAQKRTQSIYNQLKLDLMSQKL